MQQVKERVDRDGIAITYPQQDVHLHRVERGYVEAPGAPPAQSAEA
jgi:small-conductance mechanosensitive channel